MGKSNHVNRQRVRSTYRPESAPNSGQSRGGSVLSSAGNGTLAGPITRPSASFRPIKTRINVSNSKTIRRRGMNPSTRLSDSSTHPPPHISALHRDSGLPTRPGIWSGRTCESAQPKEKAVSRPSRSCRTLGGFPVVRPPPAGDSLHAPAYVCLWRCAGEWGKRAGGDESVSYIARKGYVGLQLTA